MYVLAQERTLVSIHPLWIKDSTESVMNLMVKGHPAGGRCLMDGDGLVSIIRNVNKIKEEGISLLLFLFYLYILSI
jgi:hypothetical protein